MRTTIPLEDNWSWENHDMPEVKTAHGEQVSKALKRIGQARRYGRKSTGIYLDSEHRASVEWKLQCLGYRIKTSKHTPDITVILWS